MGTLPVQSPGLAHRPRSAAVAGRVGVSFLVSASVSSFSVTSAALGHKGPVAVYVPPHYPQTGVTYPVLIMLHGLPGQGASMLQGLNLAASLNALINTGSVRPMIVVAPSDGPTPSTDAEWINSRTIPCQWRTFVDRELVSWIDGLRGPQWACTRRYPDGWLRSGERRATCATRIRLGLALVALFRLEHAPRRWANRLHRLARGLAPLLTVQASRPPAALSATHLFYVGRGDVYAAQDVGFAKLLTSLKIPYRFSLQNGGHGARSSGEPISEASFDGFPR